MMDAARVRWGDHALAMIGAPARMYLVAGEFDESVRTMAAALLARNVDVRLVTADVSRAQQTAALFTSLLESSMLSSVTAIGAEETEDGAEPGEGASPDGVSADRMSAAGVSADGSPEDADGLGIDGETGMPSIADLLALAPPGVSAQV